MSIAQIAKTTKRLLGGKKLTRKQAVALSKDIEHDDCVDGQFINYGAVAPLKQAFPHFPWRVAQDRTGERCRCFVTIMKDDPREHYTGDDEPPEQKNVYCVHCGTLHKRGVQPKGTW